MSTRIWIVVVNYNGVEDTLACLRSLGTQAPVVLVDNGSAVDPSEAVLREFPACHVLRRECNLGWAGGNNVGIQFALEQGASHVVLLNNDTEVSPNLVERLARAAEENIAFGILGPVINFHDQRSDVQTDGCAFNDPRAPGFFRRLEVPLRNEPSPSITEVEIVNGCCLMASREVFDRVGLIDERFFLVHEESDFCLRAARCGFRCGVLAEVHVWHKQSATFRRTGKQLQRYYDARNLFLLLRKHPASSRRGRGAYRSWLEYAKHVYYRYSLEQEAGQSKSADAVLEGFLDALAGRFGPYVERRHRALNALRSMVEWRRRRRARSRSRHPSSTHAG